ncbi:hypothetical protein ACF8PD_13510 [Vibrio plantisponsor]|uniref:hypothetical protein n=1 Tax=Vibrio plantisponsor TaxID=664643 RepID=UPI00370B4644
MQEAAINKKLSVGDTQDATSDLIKTLPELVRVFTSHPIMGLIVAIIGLSVICLILMQPYMIMRSRQQTKRHANILKHEQELARMKYEHKKNRTEPTNSTVQQNEGE